MSSRSTWYGCSVVLVLSSIWIDRCWAAGPVRAPAAERSPLVITSDRLEMSERDHQAVFSGQVRVVEGELQLSADRMVVLLYGGAGAPTAARKKGGGQQSQSSQVRELRADGRVVMQQSTSRGEADRAVYKVTERTLTLIGEQRPALVQRGQDRLEGSQILVVLTNDHRVDRLSVQGSDKRRVAVRLMPSSPVAVAPAAEQPAAER
ncbi:MAG: hypothetical protein HQL60_05280 [Magnetococcales bacterium]|nr:hypothetical protein [Magnetococcales bacterium]